jgi:hypothetical protein
MPEAYPPEATADRGRSGPTILFKGGFVAKTKRRFRIAPATPIG